MLRKDYENRAKTKQREYRKEEDQRKEREAGSRWQAGGFNVAGCQAKRVGENRENRKREKREIKSYWCL